MRNTRRGPLVELVTGKPPAGTVSVSAADLPLQQECVAGTTAHSISMSRRNAVEGANGNLKSNFTNVDRGYARVLGTEKVAFFLAFTLAGLNVLLARVPPSHGRGREDARFGAEAPQEAARRHVRRGPWSSDRLLSRRLMRRGPPTRAPTRSRRPTRPRGPSRPAVHLPDHTGIDITDADLDPRSAPAAAFS
jgi:hypothetical protein